jgi:kinetochore protein Nuf2
VNEHRGVQLQLNAFGPTTTTMSQSDKNTKQYWYPNMGNADIIDALDGWGLSLTHHQLVKPTPDFVLSVYGACLEKVVGLTESSLQEPVQSALSSLDEPSTVRNFG